MSDMLRRQILAVLTVLLFACASGPSVVTNSAPGFALADYQTYGFYDPLSTDHDGVQSLLSQHLIAATAADLDARGLRRDDRDPDLRINFWWNESTESVNSSPRVGVSIGGRTGGYGSSGGIGVSMSTPVGQPKTRGTIGIDLVDPVAEQLVWQGTSTMAVSNETRQQLGGMAAQAVADIFAELP